MKIKKAMIIAPVLGVLAGLLRVLQYHFALDEAGYFLVTPLSKGLQIGLVAVLLIGFGLVWLMCHGKKAAPLAGNEGKWISFPVRLTFLVLAATAVLDLVRIVLKGGAVSAELLFYLLGAIGWLILALGNSKENFWGALTLLRSGACIVAYFWSTYRYLHISEYTFEMLGLCVILLMNLQLVRGMAGATVPRERLARNCCYLLVLGFTSFIAPLFRLIQNQSGAVETVIRSLEGFAYMLIAWLILKRLPLISEAPKAPAGEESEAPDLETLTEYISELPEIEEEDEE